MGSPMNLFLTTAVRGASVHASDIPRVQCWAGSRPADVTSLQDVRATQSGVGLIEVMVAVLVLSIAFLGIAALQAVSLSTSNSAMARSMATIASYSILDAMRADSVSARAGLYTTVVTTSSCPAASATSLQSNQLYLWCKQLRDNLGTAATTTGTIACDVSGKCTVTIQFDDSRSGQGGSKTQQVKTLAVL